MAGNNDRIHGYSPHYQNQVLNPQFNSFVMQRRRPLPFVYSKVELPGVSLGESRYGTVDHQGHIVPQGMMNRILNPVMLDMSELCDNALDVLRYIRHPPHRAQWLEPALDYGKHFNMPLFDFDTSHLPSSLPRAEARLGGLFSVVTWNPINICRAPEDHTRGNYPGENLDDQVRRQLLAYRNSPHPTWRTSLNNSLQSALDGTWLDALANLSGEPSEDELRAYLSVATATLVQQHNKPLGYYRFLWVKVAGDILVPELLAPIQGNQISLQGYESESTRHRLEI